MISAFKTKADLHKMTAAAVLQKPIEEVTKADRQMAKAVSFGFLYGQSAKGFVTYARTNYGLNLSLEDAERFRENFFSTYHGFRRWHTECRRKSVNPGNDSARTVWDGCSWPKRMTPGPGSTCTPNTLSAVPART